MTLAFVLMMAFTHSVTAHPPAYPLLSQKESRVSRILLHHAVLLVLLLGSRTSYYVSYNETTYLSFQLRVNGQFFLL